MSSPGRVLIVEDEPNVAAVLGDLLAELGHTVQLAGTASDGLRLVGEFAPDVVLLDLGLPEISGSVVLARLRETDPALPVIVITGSDSDVAQRTLAPGAFDYLAKPFTLARLADVLDTALAKRH
jgi:CheY-like chemotaxis protein